MAGTGSSRSNVGHTFEIRSWNLKKIGLLLFMMLVVTFALTVNEDCELDSKEMICSCSTDKELVLPDTVNYQNITTLKVSSCESAVIPFSTLLHAKNLRNLIIHNISNTLHFDPHIGSFSLDTCELANIKRIPLISHSTFLTLQRINTLAIKNTFIEYFEEGFVETVVDTLQMSNVVIGRMDNFTFEHGGEMEIVDTEIRNISGILNFNFFRIEISNSRFELAIPGSVKLHGMDVSVLNSVFWNSSLAIDAAKTIDISNTCAEGRSNLRLRSNKIKSWHNRLPTEIQYVSETSLRNARNNTICIAGKCGCSKRNGQGRPHLPLALLAILFVLVSAFS